MIESSQGPSSARRTRLRNAAELCRFVDDLEPDVAGEMIVLVDGAPLGAVFVEQRRVCWAAARGLARRLTQLLSESAGRSDDEMEALFWTCKRGGVPLGEELVRRGIVSQDELRRALLEHTTESLASLCGAASLGTWLERSVGGYSPRFTFGTSEILSRVGASAHPEVAASSALEMAECFADSEWGAAFVRDGSSAAPVPVALRGGGPPRATSLLRVGKWAASSIDLVMAFQEPDAVCVASPSADRSMVAFQSDGALIVGEVTEHGPARVLSRRARARRARG